MSDKLGKGRSKALCYVTRLIKYVMQEGNGIFKGTKCENKWVMYHDVLTSWWSVGAQEFMRGEDFEDRQIRGLTHTNQDNRYGGKLPGDTPEYMTLDSNLFSDLACCVRWNVADTRFVPRDDPRRFSLADSYRAWSAVSRTCLGACVIIR